MRISLGMSLATLALAACGPGEGAPDGGRQWGGDGDGGGVGGVDSAALDGDTTRPIDATPGASPSYADAHFAGTHNSYSGNARGTIVDQLEAGVRSVELDIHDNDFSTSGYRVGHDEPGDAVELGGGNPEADALVAWLSLIATWSDDHPTHAPITLVIDLKDPIHDGDNQNFADGNPAHLNEVLKDAFGESLLLAADVGASFPSVDDLRGRVIVVMSGNEGTRLAYRHDPGFNVAVAVNASGHVIEVHDAGNDDLWYWTGAIEDGDVRWYRHTQYDTGRDPAVALNDDGVVVEVHNSHSDDVLFYRVGELGADFEIDWGLEENGLRFPDSDSGNDPTVRFVDRGGLVVRELHVSENDASRHFFWDGTIDLDAGTISWTRDGQSGETGDDLHDKARDETGGYLAEVSTGPSAPYDGGDTLRYRIDGGDWRLIRYEQVLFVEAQYEGSATLDDDDLWFYAANAASDDGRIWAETQRDYGGVVRLWGFNSPDFATRTAVNIPATDVPSDSWYVNYCSGLPCQE